MVTGGDDGLALDAGGTAPFALAIAIAGAEQSGITPDRLTGSIVTAPDGPFAAEHQARLGDDLATYCAQQLPRLHVHSAPDGAAGSGPAIDRVDALYADRLDAIVLNALERLAEAAQTSANLMPSLIDCARAGATTGEMIDALHLAFAPEPA